MSIFSRRFKYVTCKTWNAAAPGFVFPEISNDNPERRALLDRNNVGICFSGGGTRSAAATLGQLRGLHQLGLLSGVRYLSCVSGGSWAAVPFTYLPTTWTDEGFLGAHLPPEDLTEDNIKNLDRNGFAHKIATSVIIDNFLKAAFRFAGDETYSRALGDIFLSPFELDSLKRFFALNVGTIRAVIGRNSEATEADFYPVRRGRPYLIVGGTLLRTSNPDPLPQKIHFEMSPMYAGVLKLHRRAGSAGQHIGGGYVESFGFDSDAPERRPNARGEVKLRLGRKRHRFTLSDVIGTSGAAPAETLVRLGLDWVGFPEFKYWPVQKAPGRALKAKEYEFGDGGHLENLGVMPLLMRRVERIVVFVNTKHSITGTGLDEINNSIPPLFGKTPGFDLNHVFEDGDQQSMYESLVQALLARKQAGGTLLHRDTYRVRDATHYGITGGWDVEVLWVYNHRAPDWESRLRPEIRSMIGSGSLGNFPHYRTFFQNPPKFIDLSAKQTSMLAHLSCWNVLENEQQFRAVLSQNPG